MDLYVALLGTFSVHLDGKPITAFELDSARALLAYLVLNPAPHRRESIAALFWQDRSNESALKQLRLTLNKLRAAIPDSEKFIHSDSRTLSCRSEFIRSDTTQFESLLTSVHEHRHRRLGGCRACLEKLANVAQLYRGELLAGITLDSQAFEEWLRGERERYHQHALETLYELAQAAVERGEWRQVENYARRQLALEPWCEEAHYQLMLCYAARKQRTAALAQYRACVQLLEQELNAAPSSRTRELAEKIGIGDWRLETGISFQSPISSLQSLLGRESETSTLVARLLEPATRLVSIVSMGGMGKTRLAEHVAREIQYSFENGIVWVSLADAAAQPSIETLLDTIAEALALTRDARSLETQLLDALAERDALLVLDNLEPWLENDAEETRALISKLVRRAPRVVMLVTSRVPLAIQAEYKWLLHGLAAPPREADARLTREYPSVELFIERAERIAPPREWDAGALENVARLCALVNGSPLALELAASWMNRATLREMLANLETSMDALATHFADVPARHRSMRAVFEQSWNYLAADAQSLFARLAIFRGGFTRHAVQHIAPEKNSDAQLDTLQERSLIARDAHGRYTLHELARQFADEKMRDVERAAIADLHSQFYLAQLAAHADTLTRRSADAPLAELRADLENFRLAWETAVVNCDAKRIDAALESVVNFWQRLGLLAESARLLEAASTRAQQENAPEHLQARLHAQYAVCLNSVARFVEASEHARRAVEFAERAQDKRLRAVSELQLGYAAMYNADYYTARVHLENAQRAAERAGDFQKEADARRFLVTVHYRTGKHELVWNMGQRALELYRQANDVVGQGSVLLDLAMSQLGIANIARASQLFDQAEQCIAQSDDHSLQATAEMYHAVFLSEMGEYRDATRKFIHAAARQRQLGNRRARASILANYGRMLYATGQYDAARATLHEAIALSQEIGWHNNATWARLRLAQLEFTTDSPHAARTIAEHVLEIMGAQVWADKAGEAHLILGHVAYVQNDLPRAEMEYTHARDTMRAIQEENIILEAWAGLARVALRQGDAPRALEFIESSLPMLETRRGYCLHEPLRVYQTCYDVLRANTDTRASAILEQGYQVLQQRAATLDDATARHTYLTRIDTHRELTAQHKKFFSDDKPISNF